MGLGFLLGVAVTLAVIIIAGFCESWALNHGQRDTGPEPSTGPGPSGASDVNT